MDPITLTRKELIRFLAAAGVIFTLLFTAGASASYLAFASQAEDSNKYETKPKQHTNNTALQHSTKIKNDDKGDEMMETLTPEVTAADIEALKRQFSDSIDALQAQIDSAFIHIKSNQSQNEAQLQLTQKIVHTQEMLLRQTLAPSTTDPKTSSLSRSHTSQSPESYFTVQVGVFKNQDNAAMLLQRLARKGYPARVISLDEPAKHRGLIPVVIGKYSQRQQAQNAALEFSQKERQDAVIVQVKQDDARLVAIY